MYNYIKNGDKNKQFDENVRQKQIKKWKKERKTEKKEKLKSYAQDVSKLCEDFSYFWENMSIMQQKCGKTAKKDAVINKRGKEKMENSGRKKINGKEKIKTFV